MYWCWRPKFWTFRTLVLLTFSAYFGVTNHSRIFEHPYLHKSNFFLFLKTWLFVKKNYAKIIFLIFFFLIIIIIFFLVSNSNFTKERRIDEHIWTHFVHKYIYLYIFIYVYIYLYIFLYEKFFYQDTSSFSLPLRSNCHPERWINGSVPFGGKFHGNHNDFIKRLILFN